MKSDKKNQRTWSFDLPKLRKLAEEIKAYKNKEALDRLQNDRTIYEQVNRRTET